LNANCYDEEMKGVVWPFYIQVLKAEEKITKRPQGHIHALENLGTM
jgi:hypothetical protein